MFGYVFICDICGTRIEQLDKQFTLISGNEFVKDDSWEVFPEGWQYKEEVLKCGVCSQKETK